MLDGVIVDLYQRVEPPLDYASLSTEEHLESIAAIQRILHQVLSCSTFSALTLPPKPYTLNSTVTKL